MTESERAKISSYIEKEFGIKMPEAKKALLTGRLAKRVKAIGAASFGEYFDFIHTTEGAVEYTHFTDLVSTHETSFFREASHYDFLITTAFPALYQQGAGLQRELRILSAACSSGEEVYSAAIAAEEFARSRGLPSFRYTVTGTDISEHVILKAARGVYRASSLRNLPLYAKHSFMRSRDASTELVRVIPEIREKTRFIQMNLLDKSYPFDQLFDIVFCRNVMIYFDRPTQEKVASMLCRNIVDNGYLLVGHSESLMGFSLPIEGVAPASYIVRR
jgi:chemotaxis protein methyltransferase CheR